MRALPALRRDTFCCDAGCRGGRAATCENVACHKFDAKNTVHNCGGCSTTLYCSKECQTLAWKQGGHKTMCKMKQRERLVFSSAISLSATCGTTSRFSGASRARCSPRCAPASSLTTPLFRPRTLSSPSPRWSAAKSNVHTLVRRLRGPVDNMDSVVFIPETAHLPLLAVPPLPPPIARPTHSLLRCTCSLFPCPCSLLWHSLLVVSAHPLVARAHPPATLPLSLVVPPPLVATALPPPPLADLLPTMLPVHLLVTPTHLPDPLAAPPQRRTTAPNAVPPPLPTALARLSPCFPDILLDHILERWSDA
ncbi:hypothetical protein B0H14DRAFT_3458552 [Mycena olivaceomarginata]|nr:hypothetical protein B0H14DRAFT_3458552 [Mycena olivaceomarginata]